MISDAALSSDIVVIFAKVMERREKGYHKQSSL